MSKNILHPYLVSSSLQQEPDHLQMALVAGQGQGGLLELVAEADKFINKLNY